MKLFLYFFLFSVLIIPLTGQTVRLNEAGRIVYQEETEIFQKYKFEKYQFQIEYDELVFSGNGFYLIENGYLTIESYEESVPVVLRIYDFYGKLLHENIFDRIYNISFSPNKNYALFFDAKELISLNLTDFSIQKYPASSIFSIDDYGNPVYYDELNEQIVYGNNIFNFNEYPVKFLFYNDIIFCFTRKSLYQIENKIINSVKTFEGSFFDAQVIENELLFVEKIIEKENFIFRLFRIERIDKFELIEEKIIERNISLRHEEIPSPLRYGEQYPHPIGNSYGEIQLYGTDPYLHPGVDLLGAHFEDVYAVKDGIVKAILTTSGSLHWRIAIANEQTADSTEGYLYAHLVETSIPFAIGDTVYKGDIVGTLVPWPVADFTHIHFARIKAAGIVWNGAWWTTNNPHIDINGIIDNTPPVFENALGQDLFAFRNSNGDYLSPEQIQGEVQIISKVHDIANSGWKIDLFEISYKLFEEGAPSFAVVDNISFAYDFKLDTYFSGNYEEMILNTIYSRDQTCFSIGNYSERSFYQIITNTDGTPGIYPGDKNRLLDTRLLPNGTYQIEVKAIDASMNESYEFMYFYIDNPSPSSPSLTLPANNSTGQPVILELQWQSSQNADSYHLQVAGDEFFETIFINKNDITATTFTLDSLSQGTKYFWRVSAKSNTGASQFSNVWSFTTSGSVDVDDTGNSIPSEYVLYQNYPNPFNPSTLINYSLPAAGNVILKVYDIIGNEISTLVNEYKQAGNYKVNFNSDNIPSGVYFYQIKSGNFTDTKKMILIR